jgi:hypothetical protein
MSNFIVVATVTLLNRQDVGERPGAAFGVFLKRRLNIMVNRWLLVSLDTEEDNSILRFYDHIALDVSSHSTIEYAIRQEQFDTRIQLETRSEGFGIPVEDK